LSRSANSRVEARASFLLADVGGTNVRFALAQPAGASPLRIDTLRAFRVADFASLSDAARAYLDALYAPAQEPAPRPAHAVLALAGRIEDGAVQMTNHAWFISATRLQADLQLQSVTLVNDFAAVGMSLPLLTGADMLAVGPPLAPITRDKPRQTFCVLGPGTGMGVSALAVRDAAVLELETEGGHISFAPSNEEEIAVLRQLLRRFGRVSVERLLCGAGLANLLQALCALAGRSEAPFAPETITARAQQGSDPQCVRAVELFCEMLGAVAGDYALAYGAWDGVYLAGGLLTALQPWIQRGRFRERFNNKGRFAAGMTKVPVALITHPQPGLLGAAAYTMRAAGLPLLRSASPAAGAGPQP
jgi:glucokinase